MSCSSATPDRGCHRRHESQLSCRWTCVGYSWWQQALAINVSKRRGGRRLGWPFKYLPIKTSTGWRLLLGSVTREPLNPPYFVRTTRVLNFLSNADISTPATTQKHNRNKGYPTRIARWPLRLIAMFRLYITSGRSPKVEHRSEIH